MQIFTAPPPATALIGKFSDYSFDFRYAYFPSLQFDPHSSAGSRQRTPRHGIWRCAPADNDNILAERGGPLPMSATGESLKIPELLEGAYRLTLTLGGGTEPVVEERPLRRVRGEWEGPEAGAGRCGDPAVHTANSRCEKADGRLRVAQALAWRRRIVEAGDEPGTRTARRASAPGGDDRRKDCHGRRRGRGIRGRQTHSSLRHSLMESRSAHGRDQLHLATTTV